MSNRAIADAIGSSEPTVRRDVAATASNDAVDDTPRTTLGQDGRERSYPQPKPPAFTGSSAFRCAATRVGVAWMR